MRPSNEVSASTNFNRVLSPSDQLTIAHQLQAIRRHEDQFRAYAAENWPPDQRRFLTRLVNLNRQARFEIWRTLNISNEVLP